MWLQPGYFLTFICYFSSCRRKGAGDQIEKGCFTRSVRTNQSYDLALIDVEVDLMNGGQASKVFRDIFSFKDLHSAASTLLSATFVPSLPDHEAGTG